MTDLTPRDDVKKMVSEVLKRVDQLIKKGDLDHAHLELGKAKELDPKNVYALAFEERIVFLQKQEVENRAAVEVKRIAEEEAKRKAEEQRRKDEEEHRRKQDQLRKLATEQQALDAVRQAALPQETSPHVEGRKAEEQAVAHLKVRLEAIDTYKKNLREVWVDGVATEEERHRLNELRTKLGIDALNSEKVEKEVKYECYLDAFKKAWSSGSITQQKARLLSDLRKTFDISEDEHYRLEVKFLSELKAEKKKATILLIDDDKKLLDVIAETIGEAGYEVRALLTSDEAYAYVRNASPDLILCDINLETSTMGGFTFYEKIREFDHLQEVPFIFLTGLTDEVLVRTGKELGVDDYLTKPISEETLMATIKGKLKRFKQLKKVKRK